MWTYIIPMLVLVTAIESSSKCRLQEVADQGVSIDPDNELCAYKPFTGSIGDIVANSNASRISSATRLHAQNLVFNLAEVVKLIPIVGGFLKMSFRMYSRLYFEGPQTLIGKMVKEIEDQVLALRVYIGQKLQQLEYIQLGQILTGLLAAAKSCADYDQPSQMNDLERCLISLNSRIVSSLGRFMHANDKIIWYDWSLPLFRQYADLQLTVTLDLLRLAVALNKPAAQQDYLRRLRDQAQSFYVHSNTSVERIVQVHQRFAYPKCKTTIQFDSNSNPFSSIKGYETVCTQQFFGGRKCVETVLEKKENSTNLSQAKKKSYDTALRCIGNYAAGVKVQLEKDMRKYWQLELIDVASEWKKVYLKAKSELDKSKST